MRLIQVFDPALCCSSGVCGAEVDQNLVTFAGDAEWIKQVVTPAALNWRVMRDWHYLKPREVMVQKSNRQMSSQAKRAPSRGSSRVAAAPAAVVAAKRHCLAGKLAARSIASLFLIGVSHVPVSELLVSP